MEKECSLKTPSEVRNFLEKKDRCISCGVGRYKHYSDMCRRLLPCKKHKNKLEYHLSSTCDGPNYQHPGSQFKQKDR